MQAFPGQVNTATTATAAQTSGSVPLRLDLSYIKTVHGMLKCAQILLNLLGFICIMCSHLSTNSRCEWFNMVSMIGFWTTGILLGFYLFHVIEKLYKVPWFKIEFYFCAVETACYLLASALVAALAGASESLGVAGFFGFCAMCAYGFDTWMKFKALKSGEYPQGQPPSSKPVSTVGSPAGY